MSILHARIRLGFDALLWFPFWRFPKRGLSLLESVRHTFDAGLIIADEDEPFAKALHEHLGRWQVAHIALHSSFTFRSSRLISVTRREAFLASLRSLEHSTPTTNFEQVTVAVIRNLGILITLKPDRHDASIFDDDLLCWDS